MSIRTLVPASAEPAPAGHNRPPLEESVVTDFLDAIDPHLLQRLDDLAAKGMDPDEVADDEMAGRYGDYVKMVVSCVKDVEAAREVHNRPLLAAQRALKGRADALVDGAQKGKARIQDRLTAYLSAKRRAEQERQREADETAEKARAALEAAGIDPASLTLKEAKVERETVKGDYGASVSTKTVRHHQIDSVRKLPDRILKHERVIDALNKVIAAEIRGGAASIPGVTITTEQVATVR